MNALRGRWLAAAGTDDPNDAGDDVPVAAQVQSAGDGALRGRRKPLWLAPVLLQLIVAAELLRMAVRWLGAGDAPPLSFGGALASIGLPVPDLALFGLGHLLVAFLSLPIWGTCLIASLLLFLALPER